MVAVFGWWKRKQPQEPPLLAGPAGPRTKTYSAESGYVYQYAFIGQRLRPAMVEYVFLVTYDRINHHRISVWVSDEAIASWRKLHGRDLTASERYAVAKLALRNAFDQREKPEAIHERIAPGADEVLQVLEELDV